MTITPLPANPSLENLRKRAKTLHKAVKAGQADALAQVGPYFGDPAAISLQQAQLVIARGHGFSSWTRLKRHVEGAADEGADQLANRFLDLVTVAYGSVPDFGPKRFEQAANLLAAHPEIASTNIYTAAAVGDVALIDQWLDREPELANKKGGYFNWEPLMYAAYARLPDVSTLNAGLRLLERGADPNPYYMWGGQYKFTALTGVFGQGEGGPVNQPEHPDYVAFARALLERGANPNDSQAAYNRCFEPDNTCFELLLDYGLSAKDKNNWLLVEDDKLMPHPSETMHFHLIQSIHRGYVARAQLLVDHGVDLNRPDDSYDTRTMDKTPYQAALLLGEPEIAEILRKAGADITELTRADAFEVACINGDLDEARAVRRDMDDPLPEIRQIDLLRDAVKKGNRAAVETMIALGFDVNGRNGNTALHEAAIRGDIAIAQVLLDAGADPTLRDVNYYSTPMGYAIHGEQDEMIALLDTQEMDIFTAAMRGNLSQVQKRLAKDPGRLNRRFGAFFPDQEPPENAWTTPLVFAVAADQADIVRYLLDQGAEKDVSNGAGMSLDTIAAQNAGDAVKALLAGAQPR